MHNVHRHDCDACLHFWLHCFTVGLQLQRQCGDILLSSLFLSFRSWNSTRGMLRNHGKDLNWSLKRRSALMSHTHIHSILMYIYIWVLFIHNGVIMIFVVTRRDCPQTIFKLQYLYSDAKISYRKINYTTLLQSASLGMHKKAQSSVLKLRENTWVTFYCLGHWQQSTDSTLNHTSNL